MPEQSRIRPSRGFRRRIRRQRPVSKVQPGRKWQNSPCGIAVYVLPGRAYSGMGTTFLSGVAEMAPTLRNSLASCRQKITSSCIRRMGAASTQAFCTRLPVDPLVAIPLARAAIDTAVRKSNLPTRFDWLPAVSVRVVDIFKRRGIADLDPPRQAGER